MPEKAGGGPLRPPYGQKAAAATGTPARKPDAPTAPSGTGEWRDPAVFDRLDAEIRVRRARAPFSIQFHPSWRTREQSSSIPAISQKIAAILATRYYRAIGG